MSIEQLGVFQIQFSLKNSFTLLLHNKGMHVCNVDRHSFNTCIFVFQRRNQLVLHQRTDTNEVVLNISGRKPRDQG